MQNQKGFILPIIIVIVVITVLGATGYFVYKQYSTPKPIACTTEAKVCPDGSAVGRTGPNCEFAQCPAVPDQTAGWKTYTNTQYGFEIKYPQGTNFEINKNNIAQYGILFDANLRFMCAGYNFKITESKYSDINNWTEEIKEGVETPSNYEGAMISEKISSIDGIDVNGKIGKKIVIDSEKIVFPFYNAIFGVINDKNLYTISYAATGKQEYGDCSPQEMNDCKEVFDKILSTFRFTK